MRNEARRLPEPSPAECEAIRIHNWMKRAGCIAGKTSKSTELADVTAQMGKMTEIRDGERAIPRVPEYSSTQTSVGLNCCLG